MFSKYISARSRIAQLEKNVAATRIRSEKNSKTLTKNSSNWLFYTFAANGSVVSFDKWQK